MIQYFKAVGSEPTKITETIKSEGDLYQRMFMLSGRKVSRGEWVQEIWNFYDGKTLVEERDFLKRSASIIANHITATEPDLAYLAGKLHMEYLRQHAYANRKEKGYSAGFADMLLLGMEEGVYDKEVYGWGKDNYIYENITKPIHVKEQNGPDGHFARYIAKHGYFKGKTTYAGAKVIEEKYLGKTKDGLIFETFEERLFAMSLYLATPEKVKPLSKAFYFFDDLHKARYVPATPTFMNAGRTYGQLSSCFIETVDDDLKSIFHAVDNTAQNSKGGGGVALYMGKIRSEGASVKHVKGASKGVLSWMNILNGVAISVDQMGARQGAIAVYLDVWHRDIFRFIESANVNGDDRFKALDLFIGVCIPDLFMQKVEERGEWYLFDPHEIKQVMGFAIEDSFDKQKLDPSRGLLPDPIMNEFSYKYGLCIEAYEEGKLKLVERVPAIEIMKSIMIEQLETGRPYMFYRDTVNRANTMKEGMIYSSNLCTEIAQNMSASTEHTEFIDTENGKIIKTFTRGDYVVCNLASLVLPTFTFGHKNKDKREKTNYFYDGEFYYLRRAIHNQVRMLDNVIDLNELPVPESQDTNRLYRPIGLGTMGKHTYLANLGIRWESKRAEKEMKRIYEKIAFYTIEASMELAKEKGAFPKFHESKWADGSWFDEHNLTSKRWQKLKKKVMKYGIRNAYLMAVAPNATISHVVGVSPSHDPAYKRTHVVEKKGIRTINIAGGLTKKNYWFFKDAWLIDQKKSIRHTARVQKFVDQGISHNIYVPSDISAKTLLDYHMYAWKRGLKTTYYVRSTDVELEDCESCSV